MTPGSRSEAERLRAVRIIGLGFFGAVVVMFVVLPAVSTGGPPESGARRPPSRGAIGHWLHRGEPIEC